MIPALTSILLPGAPEARTPAGGDAQAFALSLETAGAALATGGTERQEVAAGGKALPAETLDAAEIWLPVMAAETEAAEQAPPPVATGPIAVPTVRIDGHTRAAKTRYSPLPQPKAMRDDPAIDKSDEEPEARPGRPDTQPAHPVMPDMIRYPAHFTADMPAADVSGTAAQACPELHRTDRGEEAGRSRVEFGYGPELFEQPTSSPAKPTVAPDGRSRNSASPIARADNPSIAAALTDASIGTTGPAAPVRSGQPVAAPVTGSPTPDAATVLTTAPAQARPEMSGVGSTAWMDRAIAQQDPSLQTSAAPVDAPTSHDVRPSRGERSGGKTTIAPDATRTPVPDAATFATRPALSGTAAQVFAAELRRGAQDGRQPIYEPTPLAVSELRADAVRLDAPQPPLDMRAERWPEGMIERIERLRDAADAADTTIRLSPDALGSLEISVQLDGDAVHVRFEAEQAETRALLEDAAPRLAEAAEARGIRLGQTSIGGGDAGSGRQGREPSAPPQPSAPARTHVRTDEAENSNDTRIA